MDESPPKVGAPDPELKNSPIVFETELYEPVPPPFETGEGVCYFNSTSYPVGSYVRSGDELLLCTAGGIWVYRGDAP
ncbi:MAG TPA: hypothetical protein VFK15_07785 [Burkholderiales bacterium]|nr:hypothetical protein [Burkholderiales bacterium]